MLLVWLANKKTNQHYRLAEEYLHKETVAINFVGFRDVSQEVNQENRTLCSLYEHTLKNFADNPSKTIDNKSHTEVPITEVIETVCDKFCKK